MAQPLEITVSLLEPLAGHGGQVKEVKMRPPTHADLMALGDPYVVITLADGKPHVVTEPKTLGEYIGRCLVSPDPLILEKMGLADSMRVRKAFVDFFEMALALSAGLKTPAP